MNRVYSPDLEGLNVLACESMLFEKSPNTLGAFTRRPGPALRVAASSLLAGMLAACAALPADTTAPDSTNASVVAISPEAVGEMQGATSHTPMESAVVRTAASRPEPLSSGITRAVEGALEVALDAMDADAPLPRALLIVPVLEDDWRPDSFSASLARAQALTHLSGAFPALRVFVDRTYVGIADWLLGIGLSFSDGSWFVCARVIDLRGARRFAAYGVPVAASTVDWSPQPFARERPVLPRPLPRESDPQLCAFPAIEDLPVGVRTELLNTWFALVEGQQYYGAGDWQAALDAFRGAVRPASGIGLAASDGAGRAAAMRRWLDDEANIGLSLAYWRIGAPVRAARARDAVIDAQFSRHGSIMLNFGMSPLSTSEWAPDRIRLRNEDWIAAIKTRLVGLGRCARVTSFESAGTVVSEPLSLALGHAQWLAARLTRSDDSPALAVETRATNDPDWPAALAVGDLRDEWQRRILIEAVTNGCY